MLLCTINSMIVNPGFFINIIISHEQRMGAISMDLR